MTATSDPTPDLPAGRYGKPSGPGRPGLARAAMIALGVVAVAVAAWLALGGDGLSWKMVGFSVDGPTSTAITFDVTKDADATVRCRVQALSESYAEVGVQTVEVGPAGTATQRVTSAIPTTELAVSAVVESCEAA
ncbi:DUF4307 domain-containing protein [Cellulomonas pakistanensis]|uniref:DUF4307 domain-containing protein n=1 Tax=Cellulomonas pakistanensis TaxID=992287 RepID=A0A919PE67_9CELL|nr:DUF4307 domain-containing protein [Cellulomonas pakistanensis]GIG37910.1 hypothetical protein Cpa01nite_32910 [Cellulomonas pakistanensis]